MKRILGKRLVERRGTPAPATRGDGDARAFIWQQYDSLHEQQAHFGTVQAGLRGLASVWLLTGLGAAAFLLKSPAAGERLRISSEFALASVCALVVMGLAVIWIIDQRVYQGFQGAIFIVALKLEYDHAFLPPIRTVIALNANKAKGVNLWLSLFYYVPITVLLILGLGASVFDMGGGRLSSGAFLPVGLIFCVVVGLAILGVRTKTRPIDRAPDFDDWEFEVYVATIKTSGRQVLARFDPSLSDARGRSRGGESGWRPA